MDADEELGRDVRQVLFEQGGVEALGAQYHAVTAYHNDNYLPFQWPILSGNRSTLLRLLELLTLESSRADSRLLDALDVVRQHQRGHRKILNIALDLGFASQRWQSCVQQRQDGEVLLDRHALELCVFMYLAEAHLRQASGASSHARFGAISFIHRPEAAAAQRVPVRRSRASASSCSTPNASSIGYPNPSVRQRARPRQPRGPSAPPLGVDQASRPANLLSPAIPGLSRWLGLPVRRDLGGVAREESAILAHVADAGTAILPAENRLPAPIDIPAEPSFAIRRFDLDPVTTALPLPGEHNRLNASAASAVARCFGLIEDRIEAAWPVAGHAQMRGAVIHAKDRTRPTVINDAYSANPTSIRAVLQVLTEYPSSRWAVLGDLLELGAVPAPAVSMAEKGCRIPAASLWIAGSVSAARSTHRSGQEQ